MATLEQLGELVTTQLRDRVDRICRVLTLRSRRSRYVSWFTNLRRSERVEKRTTLGDLLIEGLKEAVAYERGWKQLPGSRRH